MKRPAHPDLETSQQLFWDLVTAPRGVAAGAHDLVEKGAIDSEDLSFLVAPSSRMNPIERLDVYADMYFYRLRDCLAEDYPKVAAVVGGARFHNFVTDFLLVHPSSHPSLRYLGAPVAQMLASHALGEAFPFLADLARLEWARIDVFDETDAEPLTRAALTALAPEQATALSLRLIPACRHLDLQWSVAPLWRRIEEDLGDVAPAATHSAAVEIDDGFAEPFEIDAVPARHPVFIRAWRQDLRVYHRSMAADEAACLRRLQTGGASVIELAQVLLELPTAGRDDAGTSIPPAGNEQQALQAVMRRLAELMDLWMEDRLLCAPV